MKSTAIITLLTLLLLIFVEIFSFFILKKDQRHTSLFYQTQRLEGAFDRRKDFQDDLLLGWTHFGSGNISYFITGKKKKEDVFRILILGGSTTDQRMITENWPTPFLDILKVKLPNVKIFNGAIAGYSSAQETLKLLRDINIINPDLVISYNGVNEVTENEVPQHPYLTQQLRSHFIKESHILPNTIRWIQGFLPTSSLHLGPPTPHDKAQVWLQNHIKMNAISQAFGVQYIGILQPHLWSHEKTPTPLTDDQAHLRGFQYDYGKFYPKAKPFTDKHGFLYDGTKFLKDHTEHFIDDCHLDARGNEIVAKLILKVIKEHGVFER